MKFNLLVILVGFLGFHLPGQAQEKLAPGIICSDDNDYSITFITEDWICFTRSLSKNTLMFSHRKDGVWSEPEVAPFSGQWNDEHPSFDSESGKLLFSSKRPVTGTGGESWSNDLWYVELKDGSWSEAKHLAGNFSRKGIDSGGELEGGQVYFHSDRSGQGLHSVDLYVLPIDKLDAEPRKLSVSTNQVDGEAYVFMDGKAMLFMSAGHNAVGGSDIFLSLQKDGKWQESVSVDLKGVVNTSEWDYAPSLSPDGKQFYFTRLIGGQADIMTIPVKDLPELNKYLQ